MEKKNVCCICGKKFEGWGNNPWPIGYDVYSEEDRCCDECNETVVIPARILQLYEREKVERETK